jgi:hypothetical protein
MKKVLILSYYFPPYNGIPGWRPYSWFKHFHKYNIHPTVVTRHWDGSENEWTSTIKESDKPPIIEENESGCLISIPYQHSPFKKISDSALFKIPGVGKLYFLFLLSIGRLSVEIDAYYSFKKFLETYLKTHSFDVIIVSAPPQNIIRLGYYLSKKFNTRFIADFRDIWNNHELNKNYKPSKSEVIKSFIQKRYLKKWLKQAEFVITVSESLARKIRSITSKKVIEITNGFEEELLQGQGIIPSSSVFTISVVGTIYPQQDMSVLINGINKLISETNTQKIQLNFIGIEAIKSVASELKSKLSPDANVYTSARVPREEAIKYTLSSHILVYPGWKNYEGIYSGKIFEYLGAQKNILIAPGDMDIIDQLVEKSGAGKIAHTETECFLILKQWFDEWEKNGSVRYSGKKEIINTYTRESLAKTLADYILSLQ